jgi:hypothetical protein
MFRHSAILVALAGFGLATGTTSSRKPGSADTPSPLVGRWDITIAAPNGGYPSWLEVTPSGNGYLVGSFVGIVGSARPISRVGFADNVMRFAIPPQWESGTNDLVVEGRLQGDTLVGTMTFPDGSRMDWSGKRAPALRRTSAPKWGPWTTLFNGRDLTGWHATGPNQWRVANRILQNPKSGANIVSDSTFTDYQLHVEFRFPKGSNSGVYQRGRYEVQIVDSVTADTPDDLLGSVYGFIAPSGVMPKGPNQWQSFDVTLVGRMITVVVNGKTVICNREIPGITGGALDSKEGAPGPLLLQGDHGPIEYRNIRIRRAR